MKTRKRLTMLVTVSLPVGRSAAFARKEVKNLITHGTGWHTHAGEELKCIAAKPAPREVTFNDDVKSPVFATITHSPDDEADCGKGYYACILNNDGSTKDESVLFATEPEARAWAADLGATGFLN